MIYSRCVEAAPQAQPCGDCGSERLLLALSATLSFWYSIVSNALSHIVMLQDMLYDLTSPAAAIGCRLVIRGMSWSLPLQSSMRLEDGTVQLLSSSCHRGAMTKSKTWAQPPQNVNLSDKCLVEAAVNSELSINRISLPFFDCDLIFPSL